MQQISLIGGWKGESTLRLCRWAAALGVILAVSRAFIYDEAAVAFHPDLAMLQVSFPVPAIAARFKLGMLKPDLPL